MEGPIILLATSVLMMLYPSKNRTKLSKALGITSTLLATANLALAIKNSKKKKSEEAIETEAEEIEEKEA